MERFQKYGWLLQLTKWSHLPPDHICPPLPKYVNKKSSSNWFGEKVQIDSFCLDITLQFTVGEYVCKVAVIEYLLATYIKLFIPLLQRKITSLLADVLRHYQMHYYSQQCNNVSPHIYIYKKSFPWIFGLWV